MRRNNFIDNIIIGILWFNKNTIYYIYNYYKNNKPQMYNIIYAIILNFVL